MANQCSSCGAKLGVLERMRGLTLCAACAKEQKRLQEEAKNQYAVTLRDIYNGKTTIEEGKKSWKPLMLRRN